MEIWLDIHLSPALCGWISATFGVQCRAMRDLGMQRTQDVKAFEQAAAANAVIMTKDADFVRILDARGAPPQILWLTCGNTSNEHLRHLLAVTLPGAIRRLQEREPLVEIGDAPKRA